ncbi:MAG: alanine--glyoxylate aminotransferase family protein [Nevskiales bacterium]|nr:alanine--glyoxylate aminotransferase family protein [Nevskiales bacterium]
MTQQQNQFMSTPAAEAAPAPVSFVAPRRTLMGPGPSDVHPRVLAAMAQPTIGHLDPAFVGLMDTIKQQLRRVFRTQNELTMPVSGPGSVGMEACFVNILEPGDTIVVCENGVFGGRMKQVAQRCGAKVVAVDDPWGRAIDPAKVDAALTQHPDAKALAFVHAETSTGALSDAATLAEIARKHGVLTIVDAVTSLGGVPLEVDAWQLDAVYSGTQKCLSAPPGLSPVTFSARAVEVAKQRKTPVQSWFMDINLVTGYWSGGAKRAYHHTAPVNALYGLHEALCLVEEEGLENAWARHRRVHEQLVAGLEGLGLKMLVPAAERIPQLNAVMIPDGVSDEAALRSRLLTEFGLEIGAGLGEFAGKVWRIGLMGQSCTEAHVQRCLDALKSVLGR